MAVGGQEGQPCTVLIVEDEADVRELVREMLAVRFPSLRLAVAANGREGLQLFHELHPEIVVTDINMPLLTGIGMAEEIRRLSSQVHIIVMTGCSDSGLLVDCIRIGISRFLPKPIILDFLFEAVEECLEQVVLRAALKVQHEKLAERDERLRLALDSAELGTLDFQVETGLVFWDERCRQMLGAPDADSLVPYRLFMRCLHPQDRLPFTKVVSRALRRRESHSFRRKMRTVRGDGSAHWLVLTGRLYHHDGDAGRGRLVGVVADITQNVMVQAELYESEARYQRLFRSMQEGFSLHAILRGEQGVDYSFLDVNPAFEKIAGAERERLVGRTLKEVFPDLATPFLEALERVALTGEPAVCEYLSELTGSPFEVHVYSPHQGQVALLYSDVAERMKLQEEREKNDRLQSLGVLAGGIAHDFNNILTVIMGNISLALGELDPASTAAGWLRESELALQKSTGLTRQLLTFAKGGEPVMRVVDTEASILEATELVLRGSGCKPCISVHSDVRQLHADPGQLQQVLNNLIINAVQAATGRGSISVSAADDNGQGWPVPPGRYVRITVADEGAGISEEVLPKIFDPYFTTKPTGTGLGLASVYSIVTRHGGAVRVSSVPNEGTTFEVLLRAADDAVIEKVSIDAPVSTAHNLRILVMDDQPAIASTLAAMLTSMGHAPQICFDGADAVQLYDAAVQEGAPFAAVILDMTVPGGMGGMETALRLRELDQEAVLILSSGYSNDLSAGPGIGLNWDGILAKPYSRAHLVSELERALRRTLLRHDSLRLSI